MYIIRYLKLISKFLTQKQLKVILYYFFANIFDNMHNGMLLYIQI